MMLKWRIPLWRRSLPLLPLQPEPQGPAVMPLLGCCSSPGGGQQCLGRLTSNQVLNQHPWQQLVSNFGMTLWQNKSKTHKFIKEAKAHSSHSIREAEAHCSLAIWEAESWGAAQACSILQLHAKDVQHLKEESLEEERGGQLNFLSACQATLKAIPPESHGVLTASYHLLLGHGLMSNLFTILPGASPSPQGSIPGVPSPSAPTAPEPLPRPKWWHHLPDLAVSSPPGRPHPK